jgi:hypothetical protein
MNKIQYFPQPDGSIFNSRGQKIKLYDDVHKQLAEKGEFLDHPNWVKYWSIARNKFLKKSDKKNYKEYVNQYNEKSIKAPAGYIWDNINQNLKRQTISDTRNELETDNPARNSENMMVFLKMMSWGEPSENSKALQKTFKIDDDDVSLVKYEPISITSTLKKLKEYNIYPIHPGDILLKNSEKWTTLVDVFMDHYHRVAESSHVLFEVLSIKLVPDENGVSFMQQQNGMPTIAKFVCMI